MEEMVQREIMELLDLGENLALLETMDYLAVQVQEVNLVKEVVPDLLEQLVHVEMMELLELLVNLVPLAPLVIQDFPVVQAPRVKLELLVLVVQMVLQELEASQDPKAQLV